jgi:hypothetical protein
MALTNLYNARWLTPAYAPACLLGAFALQRILKRVDARRGFTARRGSVLLCAMAICVIGLWRYNMLIASPDLQDLSLKMVLAAKN